jgi:hypothetical protein
MAARSAAWRWIQGSLHERIASAGTADEPLVLLKESGTSPIGNRETL